MDYSNELAALLELKRDLLQKIESFVDEHQNELVKDLCKDLDLDPIKSEVHIYGLHGNVHAFYKNIKEYRTREAGLSDTGTWKTT